MKSTNGNRQENPPKAATIENEWQLIQALETQSETSQADLAARAGVAVGTVNWYLKKWAAKGYVKIKRIDRWRWSYLLTPQGMARKATLAREYVDASMALYRRTRAEARRLIKEIKDAGHDQVYIDGEGEIADVCRLTCLEMGIETHLRAEDEEHEFPQIFITGTEMSILWHEQNDIDSDRLNRAT